MGYLKREMNLIKPLATGGLATVFLATDSDHGHVSRTVAFFHDDMLDAAGLVSRLAERVALGQRVQHPGAVRTLGVFDVEGRLALVSELIDGKDLERVARRERIPGPVAARIGVEVTRVLSAALDVGLVHGLLGPTRVRVSSSGQVRVMGLGDEVGALIGKRDPLFYEDKGAQLYAAPELLGGTLTSAGDVYALASLLTRVISGRWPKRAAQDAAAQADIATGAMRVVQEAGASEAIADFIHDCMLFQSDRRPTLEEVELILNSEAADDVSWTEWVQTAVQSSTDLSETNELAATDLQEPAPSSISTSDSAAVVLPSGHRSPVEPIAEQPTELDEPDDALTADGSLPSASGEPGWPLPVLGSLPPPPTTDEVARPLAVAGGSILDEPTEFVADPDTVDEPTVELTQAIKAQVDGNADRWDRMLGLDLKADGKLDKEWVRAARGESEHQRFLVFGALAVFLGLLALWKLGAFESTIPPLAVGPMPPKSTVSVDVPAVAEFLPEEPDPVEGTAEEPAPEKPDTGAATEETEETEPTEDPAPEEAPAVVDVEGPAEDVPAEVPAVVDAGEPAETADKAPAEAVPPPEKKRRARRPRSRIPRSIPAYPPPTPDIPPPRPAQRSKAPAQVSSGPSSAFRVTGDAHEVKLIGDGRTVTGGQVPPGSYRIQVVFRPGDDPQSQGTLTLADGESAIVNCKAAFYRCTIRGPWK